MTTTPTEQQQLLQDYLALVSAAGSHDARRFRFLTFAREALGVDLQEVEIEHHVYRGRVDAMLGHLVFEFKSHLDSELLDAEAQLARYIGELRSRHPGAAYTGVATDGVGFRLYAPVSADEPPTLEEIGEFDLSRSEPEAAFLWLDALFAYFRAGRRDPTAQNILAALGPVSPTFRRSHQLLSDLFRRVKDDLAVQVRYREWQSYVAIVYGGAGGDQELFLRHSYLATLARLIAFHYLQPAGPHVGIDLAKVVNGEYFREQDIYNFIEEDFFTWFLSASAKEEGLELVRRLSSSLGAYDFALARQDLLKGLYQELVEPQARHALGEYYTPDWLADYILSRELRVQEQPERSLLDPACGSGTFLFIAIRLVREALAQAGKDDLDILLHVTQNVMGMDVHPVAVTVARTNYLLALGELARGPHPPLLLPVYLANAIQLPEVTTTQPIPVDKETRQEPLEAGYEEPVHIIPTGEPNVAFELPDSVVADPAQLDWLFHRLQRYLAGAEARAPREGEEGIRQVLDSLYHYLTSPKRAGVRVLPPLSSFAADVMCRTARTLITLVLEGKDTVWLDILRNMPAPVFLSRRQFDLLVGNPPWLSLRYIQHPRYRAFVRRQILYEYKLVRTRDTHLFTHMELATLFFARAADLYLKQGGSIGFVMPRAIMTAGQHEEFTGFSYKDGSLTLLLKKVLDLDRVSPLFKVPACVLLAIKGEETTFPVDGSEFQGELPSHNASLEQATAQLTMTRTRFERTRGKLLQEGTAGPPAGAKSYYADKFYQGATLVPRNMWFVQLREVMGFNPDRPPLQTDEEVARRAKVPWTSVRMSGNVESEFLYATLVSGDLVPFGCIRLSPVLLPLTRRGDRLTLVTRDLALEQDNFGLAQWLQRSEEEWADNGAKDADGRLRMQSVLNRLDYHRLLTRQSPACQFRVFFPRSGTNVTSAILDVGEPETMWLLRGTVRASAFVADFDTYALETNSLPEANYLSGVLNSSIVDDRIKGVQTRGLLGPRDITRRPLDLPIPQFDPSEATHTELAGLSQQCHERVKQVLSELTSRYRSIGKIRGEVRRLLREELQEIDDLVRELL